MSLMLQRVREWLTLVLLVLLPFHAFAVTVLTKLMVGPGHPPLSVIAFWKEGILGIIMLFASIEFLRNGEWRMENGELKKIDWIDGYILLLLVLAFFVSILNPQSSILNFALGFKYDFIPLVAFVILRRVSWSDFFWKHAKNLLLIVASIVSVYGLLTLFLPDYFFTLLGYSDLHSLYVANGPLAAFQQIGGSSVHRIQSTFSGPNQFGIWLLLPIALSVASVTLRTLEGSTPTLFKRVHASSVLSMTRLALFLIALFFTFSRAAWIGTFVIVIIALYPWVKAHITRGRLLGAAFLFIALLFTALALFPNTLLRLSSTRGHIERPIAAIQKMIAHPFGLGLGSAGPATNRSSDTCVMLRPGDDPSWAKPHADLCVFVGEEQVQPLDRSCNCPFLPENWYLQVGVELGFLGLILYLCLMGGVLWRLYECKMQNEKCKMKELSLFDLSSFYILHSTFYIFLAVSIAGLFLHSWEDAAIAYSVWLLIAARLSVADRE